jgi:hypothetical protein
MWLRDFLPDHFAAAGLKVRILTFGYKSGLKGSTSHSSVPQFARQFLDSLNAARDHVVKVRSWCHGREQQRSLRHALTCNDSQQERNRPIVFIAHSLGGLVLKQVCVPPALM